MVFHRFRTVVGLALALALVCAASASAASLQMHLEYVRSYNAQLEPVSYVLLDGMVADAADRQSFRPFTVVQPTDIHQFDIYFQLDPTSPPDLTGGNPAAGQVAENSLGAILLDVEMGRGVRPDPNYGYLGVLPNPTYDPAGTSAARALYTENSDQGDADLQDILIVTDALAAHGLDPGESAPALLGSFFVNWDWRHSDYPTGLRIVPSISAALEPWGLWNSGWIDMTPPYSHAAGMLIPMSSGTMFASVNHGDYDPTDAFDFLNPEPSSAVLAGLAMIGLIGLARRR